MLNNEDTPMEAENLDVCTIKKRKLYAKPHLEEIGDLRTVTLGPSPGQYESGPGDLTYKNDLEI
jgi:hypothetical protein